MSVYKREYEVKGKPCWYYQFRLNKRKYASAGFATEKEAKNAEQNKLNALNSKQLRPIENDKVSIGQFLPKFIAHRKVVRSEETAIREERRSRTLLKTFGDRRLTQVTVSEIHEYVAHRSIKDGLKNRSINLELTLLRSIYSHAIECKFASENPAMVVTNLTEPRDEKWCPSVQELQKLVDEAEKTASALVLVPWLWFRAYSGTRPKESVFLEWADIDFLNNRISIRPKVGNQLKNSAVRYVEIHPELKPILLKWKMDWDEVFDKRHKRHPDEQCPPHDWVFFNPHAQLDRAVGFRKCFCKARKNAGIPKMTSHTLRHYFISQAVMSGVELLTIAKWVGHIGTKMIERVYGHLRPDYRLDQMSKVRIIGSNDAVPSLELAPENSRTADLDRPAVVILARKIDNTRMPTVPVKPSVRQPARQAS